MQSADSRREPALPVRVPSGTEPLAAARSTEVRLTLVAVLVALALAVPAGIIGAALAGARAAAGAAAGCLLMALLGAAVVPLYRWAAARGAEVVVRVAPLAIVVRLLLAVVVMAIVDRLAVVSMVAFAGGLAAALLCTTAAEMVVSARDPRLSWVDATLRKAERTRT